MFYTDQPISKGVEDRLGRNGFSKMLARAIIGMNDIETFSIGLFGKWGCGKTSLVNMTLQQISELQKNTPDEEKIVVIHFEPWNFSDTNQLLSQFFIRLSSELRNEKDKGLEKIGDAVEKYSDAFELAKLIPIFGGIISYAGEKGASEIAQKLQKGSGGKDIQKQKEYIVKLLREQKRKILIIIDDIDRLNNSQISQVFQLIASVAKFPNTIYLVVFDKEIVVKALEETQNGSGEDYLEKVIQMPIQVPDITGEKLHNILNKQLDKIIKEYPLTCFRQEEWQHISGKCVYPFIDSIRNVNRLCNSVKFKLMTIAAEVNFTDIVAISAAEIFLPSLYDWIKQNKVILTNDFDFSSITQNKKPMEWRAAYEQIFREQYESQGSKDPAKGANVSLDFLSALFPYFAQKIGRSLTGYYSQSELRKNNRISHPEKFDRYFDFDLDNIKIKKSEVLKALFEMSSEEFGAYLLQCDCENNVREFLDEITANLSDLSSPRAKIILIALFHVTAKIDDSISRSFFQASGKSYAAHRILDLLNVIEPQERYAFMHEIVDNADKCSMQTVAFILNLIELSYGRLAAKGQERDLKKVLSLQELEDFEKVFTKKIKSTLQKTCLFDFEDWSLIFYLLEQFDADFVKRYLAHELTSDKNVVHFAANSVSVWSGYGARYEVGTAYQKYISAEKVLQSINSIKNSREIFSLPESIQKKSAAFFLHAQSEAKHENIEESAIDELLRSWTENSADYSDN